ncbi:MAG: Cache 3/Cache 2 fusion domain-containing protein [Gammaproteobacteria bacterium]|nr:Cache 3/Cache 2 fusion domain-containing protein [Gammaproteobacteria bacterium]
MTSTETTAESPPRQSFGLIFGLLVLLIFVETMTVFAVLASQRMTTEKALQQYTNELLRDVVDETRENAASYLRQAQDSVLLTAGVMEAGLISIDEPETLERYFLEQLRIIPQIDALYFGDDTGRFVFSKRSADSPESLYLSKIIRPSLAPEQRVTLIRRGHGLDETSRRNDPDDTFDPRLRPWFNMARGEKREIWTDPYIFYTSQRPGLTVAAAIRGADARILGVVGADIELSALTDFLRRQRIGATGAAFIVHSNGDVLAHPDATGLAQRDESGTVRLKRLADFDRVTALAGARLDAHHPDLSALQHTYHDRFVVGEQRYLSMFMPLLSQGDQQWVMGVYAPEDELAQRIRNAQRESVFLGVAVSMLVITAAVLVGLIALRPVRAPKR